MAMVATKTWQVRMVESPKDMGAEITIVHRGPDGTIYVADPDTFKMRPLPPGNARPPYTYVHPRLHIVPASVLPKAVAFCINRAMKRIAGELKVKRYHNPDGNISPIQHEGMLELISAELRDLFENL